MYVTTLHSLLKILAWKLRKTTMSHILGLDISLVRFTHRYDPGTFRVAALTAYFDASGTEHSGTELVVSGFVSTVKKWKGFEREWQALLDDAGVPYFHMKEFAPSTGIFASWKNQEPKRRKFLAKLINITVKYVEHSFAAGVLLKDWRSCNRLYRLKEEDFGPYSLRGWACIDEVYQWCAQTLQKRDQVLFMFEEGHAGQDKLKRRVALDFGIKIRTGPKISDPAIRHERPILPLQAADFASWHIRRIFDELANKGKASRADMRWDFGELFSRVKIGERHRHFAMTAAAPIKANTGILRRSLGVPSLVKFCVEYGHVPSRS
jgi:hypothetical protein